MFISLTFAEAGGELPLSDNNFPGTNRCRQLKKKLPANKLEETAILDSLCS